MGVGVATLTMSGCSVGQHFPVVGVDVLRYSPALPEGLPPLFVYLRAGY